MTTKNNLIDQVGGIEKAREIVESSYKNAFFEYEDGLFVSVEDLCTAIAKHDSREFKAGDLVIKTHPKNTILWPVLGVYKNGGVWLDYKGFCWKPPRVRHATPAEIKAGHRIDGEISQ